MGLLGFGLGMMMAGLTKERKRGLRVSMTDLGLGIRALQGLGLGFRLSGEGRWVRFGVWSGTWYGMMV